ncbi:atrial natriuretic peptide receptor 1-like [Paramacrobiotus metropolitanus]|uniref:atrial natriuretic peptide receptor 1-like n=1 Tax=Paramacrobiotus metropolitanus TaxID=2943436 RepID=UPI002445AC65|nr:atrial natriuretic peptide receptor 1-like [Paramacrobiotus metropolitanus]
MVDMVQKYIPVLFFHILYCKLHCARGNTVKEIISPPASNASVPLHIITVINGNNNIFGYNAIAPVYDAALANAKKTFGFSNVTYTMVYKRGSFLCWEAGAEMLTTSAPIFESIMKRPNDFTVMFAPGCSLEIISLGDFVREWDIPLFSAIASDRLLANKKRYPTVLTFAAVDHNTVSQSVQLLLEKYKWRTLTFFCDSLTQYPALQTYYTMSCSNMRRNLEAYLPVQYVISQLDFDSKSFQDYGYLLRRMQSSSRVAVLFTHPKILRQIMITAKKLNMTNGDYIYLSSQPTQVPTLGTVEWKLLDDHDNAAFEAFQSLIYFNNVNPNWKNMQDILGMSERISETFYNTTIPKSDVENDMAVAAYESFSAFAQIWNDVATRRGQKLTGSAFARELWNRTFVFPSRSMYISENGMRRTDVTFSKLNKTSELFEVAWQFDAISSTLNEITPALAESWYGNNGAPVDVPRCGFHQDLCPEALSGNSLSVKTYGNHAITGVTIGVSCCVIILAIGLFIVWKRRFRHDDKRLWWCLEESLLQTKESLKTSNRSSSCLIVSRSTDVTVRHEQKLQLFGQYDQAVWAEAIAPYYVSPEEITRQKYLRETLNVLKDMNHNNIGRFFGVLPAASLTTLIFEFGSRGTLLRFCRMIGCCLIVKFKLPSYGK